jgi:hypothetical protein
MSRAIQVTTRVSTSASPATQSIHHLSPRSTSLLEERTQSRTGVQFSRRSENHCANDS